VSQLRITGGPVVAKIELDGTDISNAVRGLNLAMSVDSVPRVELDVLVLDASSHEVEGVAAYIPDATRELLLKLGWTAPPEE
jgi:hypothetical protein